MTNQINNKKVLVIWILLIISSGFLLACDKNVFSQKKKNITNNHDYLKNSINHSKNYEKECKDIMFNINILKTAISQNNILLKNYNKVFSHNINYIHYKKRKLYKKIHTANLSITSKLTMLNNMINIVWNHPYNYLKLFQNNNYYMPAITANELTKKYSSTICIKTLNSKITNCNININSISFQSEEALIGISSINSVISSTKQLIFSKVNFNYIKIYYFSNYLNNLIIYNNCATNTYNSTNKSNLNFKNKFINKFKSNYRRNAVYSKNYLSNKISNGSYILNKPYIIISPLLVVAGVVVIILGGGKVKREKPNDKQNNSSSELIPMDDLPPAKRRNVDISSDSIMDNTTFIPNTVEAKPLSQPCLQNVSTENLDESTIPWVPLNFSTYKYSVTRNNDIVHFVGPMEVSYIDKTAETLDEVDVDSNSNEEFHKSQTIGQIKDRSDEHVITYITSPSAQSEKIFEIPVSPVFGTGTTSSSSWHTHTHKNITLDKFTHTNHWQKTIGNNNNSMDNPNGYTNHKLDEPVPGYLLNNPNTNREVLFPDGILLSPFVSERNYMRKGIDITVPTHTLLNTSDTDDRLHDDESVLFSYLRSRRVSIYPMAHTAAAYDGSLIVGTENNNHIKEFNNEEKICLVNKWFNFTENQKAKYFKLLYSKSIKVRRITSDSFIAQVKSFIHQKKLSSHEGWIEPDSVSIFSNVRKRIKNSNDSSLTKSEREVAISTFNDLTKFESREEISSLRIRLTTNGWFKWSTSNLKKMLLRFDTITTGDYHYLENQNKLFDNIILLLSNCDDSQKYSWILSGEISNITDMSTTNPEITQLDRFIINEIILDLKELVYSYKSLINIEDIDVNLLKNNLETRYTFPFYIDHFKRTKAVKTVFDGPKIYGTSENDIFGLIKKFDTV